jgi:NAD(P)-dependent dehydrogenase (short-subunit alcohol dehydrogenase family)
MSTLNPKPRDLNKVVLVVNGDECRLRRDDEATESLVSKLAQFYADRTLTKAPITPADQAEAYFILVSQRLSKTTGQIVTVDGGLHEAFLR